MERGTVSRNIWAILLEDCNNLSSAYSCKKEDNKEIDPRDEFVSGIDLMVYKLMNKFC